MNPRLYFMSPFNKTLLIHNHIRKQMGKEFQDSKAIEMQTQDLHIVFPGADSMLLVCCLQMSSNKGKQLKETTQANVTSFKGSPVSNQWQLV